ncbi:hypothetical protein DFJ73DRAFT_848565 [Zopfochytrium polystomum]|nr:hypothetical protein DFJ73DRAFT_848565 [Zopfochytrium polystomum]
MSTIDKRIDDHLTSISDDLRAISLDIHSNPELAFKEHRAHTILSDYMEKQGFTVTRKACGLDTAFVATWTSSNHADAAAPPVHAAFLSEYDALPQIGHACGHNLIAIAGVAAALAFRHVAALDGLRARVTLLGTPGEEDAGGKINMINAGALQGVDYFGKAAHAAAAPWEGVNALDAMLLAFQGVGLLRQQCAPSNRIHGVIKKGGDAANVIPDHTVASFMLRSEKVADLASLRARVLAVFAGAATATGCTHAVREDPVFADVVVNPTLAARYAAAAAARGCAFPSRETQLEKPYGSTDMGNVSQVVPALHPVFDVGGCDQEIHTIEFEKAAKSPGAHANALRAAACVAETALACCVDPELLRQVKKDFEEVLGPGGGYVWRSDEEGRPDGVPK